MKKALAFVVVLAALAGVAAYLYFNSNKAKSAVPNIADVLTLENTVALAGWEDLSTILPTIEQIANTIDSLPTPLNQLDLKSKLDPQKVDSMLGFNARTVEGIADAGLDAKAGITFFLSMPLEGQSLDDSANCACAAFRITNQDKFKEKLAKFALETENQNIKFEAVDINGLKAQRLINTDNSQAQGAEEQLLMAQKGGFDILCSLDSPRLNKDEQQQLFANIINAKGTPLSATASYKQAWANRQDEKLFAYLNIEGILSKLGDKLSAEDKAFYAKRFPALSAYLGESSGLNIVLDETSQIALQKIFEPAQSRAHLAKYLPADPAIISTFSFNFENFIEGVSALLPPSQPKAKAAISTIDVMMQMLLAFTTKDLAQAFDGNFALSMPASLNLFNTQEVLFVIGVKDPVKFNTVFNALSKSASVSDITIANISAKKLELANQTLYMLQKDQVALISLGTSTIEAALNTKGLQGEMSKKFNENSLLSLSIKEPSQDTNKAPEYVFSRAYLKDNMLQISGNGFNTMLIGAMAAVAIPAFNRYIENSRQYEAQMREHEQELLKRAKEEAEKELEDLEK